MEPTLETALYVGGAVLAVELLFNIGKSVTQIAPSRQEHTDVLEQLRDLRDDFKKLQEQHRHDINAMLETRREIVDRTNDRLQILSERQAVVMAELKQIREEMERFHKRFSFFEGPPDKGEN